MDQKEFDKLELLDKEAIQDLAEQLEKSYTVISISTTRSEEGDARFNIIYEGNEMLLYNSALALFRSGDRITEIMNKAYLEVLHERTIEGYSKGEMIMAPTKNKR